MIKKLLPLLTLSLIFLASPELVFAQTNTPKTALKEVDPRALILKYYLKSVDSPLQNYSNNLVQAAEKYGINWELLSAISAVESGFGRRIPRSLDKQTSSYNAWGWGVYGGRAIYFDSWEQSIDLVSKGIAERFFSRGWNNPNLMNVHYSSNPDWGWQVDYYLADIDGFTGDFLERFAYEIDAYNEQVRALRAQPKFDIPKLMLDGNGFSLGLVLN